MAILLGYELIKEVKGQIIWATVEKIVNANHVVQKI
jgi:hypothetical protein